MCFVSYETCIIMRKSQYDHFSNPSVFNAGSHVVTVTEVIELELVLM